MPGDTVDNVRSIVLKNESFTTCAMKVLLGYFGLAILSPTIVYLQVSTCGTQALYVMISRAVSQENLAMMHWFPSNNLDQRLSPTYQKEFDRLKTLDERTTAEFKQRRWRCAMVRPPKKP
jgi:hypothetical protein